MTITISRDSCRVCLKLPSANKRFKLDELDEDNKKIADKFTECSGIILSDKFQYARSICKTCLNHLKGAYNFRAIAQKTENTLQLFIRSQSENKNRVIISINNGKTYTLPKEISLKVIKNEKPFNDDSTYVKHLDEFNDNENEIELIEVDDIEDNDEIIEEHLSVSIIDGDDDDANDDDDDDLLEVLSIQSSTSDTKLKSTRNEKIAEKIQQHVNLKDKKNISIFEPWMNRNLRTTYFNYKHGVQCQVIKSNIPGESSTIRIPLKNNSKSRSKSLVCEICGNVYQQYSQLRDHLQWHKGDKEFDCEICGKQFLRKSYMLKHFKKHTGIKPFKCNFCSRTFYMNGECRAHERTHSGIRKYKCKICDKSFMYSQALKNHSLIHQEIKLYSCEECGKEFRLLHHLKQHLVTNTHKTELMKLKIKRNQVED